MTVVAYALAVVLNLFILYIGVRYLLKPYPAAAGYGVPATHDRAYLEIKGLRDAVFGIVGLVLLIFVGTRAEAWFMLAVALAPLGDCLIVLRHGGTKAVAFGVHFATAVVVLVSAGLLFAL
ncbi:uncharacterized protein DUF4267 [Promicromonospora sp. AC04]|uniref:DUF4267 domain-containing protein n=1 Tax=Promicromonospora sp. AC04 TaxID=2135723 RepID=UPI000D38BF0D|nr:DUF4267 domain-containing protein [Promicromonospora sp. AC04]PUB27919.1 uncharacterized protein DUF4267 [Promicromonospora sp. AC04]